MKEAFFLCLNEAAFYIAAFFTAGMVLFFTELKYRMDRQQSRILRLLLLDIMLSAAVITMCVFAGVRRETSAAARQVYYVGHYFYYLIHAALAPLFCHYLFSVTGEFQTNKQVRGALLGLPIALSELLIFFNPLTRWVYSYDASLILQQEWGAVILYLASAAYVLAAGIAFFQNWQGMTWRRHVALIFFLAFTLAGILLQIFIPWIKGGSLPRRWAPSV